MAHSFMEKNPSVADSRRASCQLLTNVHFNTGKLPPEGLPRNSDRPECLPWMESFKSTKQRVFKARFKMRVGGVEMIDQ